MSAPISASEWLFQHAIPLWLEHGVDWKRGGYLEALDPRSLTSPAAFKRLRVLTRQIYVFSQGALHGVKGSVEAVEHGIAFLLGPMRHSEGGFIARVDLDGRSIDPTRDLYDLAFTLFALAHAFRLGHDEKLKSEALSLLTFVEQRMGHSAGGYIEGIPAQLPRRQNPHMHLLEAGLACAEYMPDLRFEHLCDRLIELFQQNFMDPAARVLFEFYTDDLEVERDPEGRAVVEPGHHFEWAWLLAEYARVRGRIISGGPELAAFALSRGIDARTGLLYGELYDDGTVSQAAVRIWPHCEWLKAALALRGRAGSAATAWHALQRFLDMPVRGLFREHWDPAEDTFLETPAPASSLYHITTAITALSSHEELIS